MYGNLCEWLKQQPWKGCSGVSRSRVRIPQFPQYGRWTIKVIVLFAKQWVPIWAWRSIRPFFHQWKKKTNITVQVESVIPMIVIALVHFAIIVEKIWKEKILIGVCLNELPRHLNIKYGSEVLGNRGNSKSPAYRVQIPTGPPNHHSILNKEV